jgi:ubiquinone/menaquinone biosynthesis C-methylase UbiE
MKDSTTRFSDRVENYVKYRPHYPPAILNTLKNEIRLKPEWTVADIGSGTGFSSELFLENGNTVNGIEPNKEMRKGGEQYLKKYKNFNSINGTAEATWLQNNSVDMIVAGQAFHWFNIDKAKVEFRRILKPGGYVVLMWNIRITNGSPLMDDYENLLLKFGKDYKEVGHTNMVTNEIITKFFGNGYSHKEFDNEQIFDYDGLKGRFLSASYVPDEKQPNYRPMIAKLEGIFHKHKKNGKVKIPYIAEVYYGTL